MMLVQQWIRFLSIFESTDRTDSDIVMILYLHREPITCLSSSASAIKFNGSNKITFIPLFPGSNGHSYEMCSERLMLPM